MTNAVPSPCPACGSPLSLLATGPSPRVFGWCGRCGADVSGTGVDQCQVEEPTVAGVVGYLVATYEVDVADAVAIVGSQLPMVFDATEDGVAVSVIGDLLAQPEMLREQPGWANN